jgi:alkylhydroperoxidase family enzyme
MAHLPYVSLETATGEAQTALARLPQQLNIFRMVAHAPTVVGPFIAMGSLLLYTLELSAPLREISILRLAQLTGAQYEWVQHEVIGAAAGVRSEQIAAIARGETAGTAFSPEEACVLDFVTEVVQRGAATETTLRRVMSHLPPRPLIELMLVIGYYLTIAQITQTMAIEIDPPGWMDKVGAPPRAPS